MTLCDASSLAATEIGYDSLQESLRVKNDIVV